MQIQSGTPTCEENCKVFNTTQSLDTKSKLNTHVDFTGHLYNFRELNRFLSGILKVLNGKDLQTRLVQL